MVFFVCEGCNETLKKNKVDAHAARCRDCFAVSCVDCSVVFPGNEYASHTSCISEAQKYEGALYKEKKTNGKKQSPQEKWMQVVANAQAQAPTDSKELQNLLDRVRPYDNVPRKQSKFMNFVKNSIGVKDTVLASKLYEFYDALFKAQDSQPKQDESKPTERDAPSKKRKQKDEQEPPSEGKSPIKKHKSLETDKQEPKQTQDKPSSSGTREEINWVKAVKKVLRHQKQKQMELKELRNKVFEHLKLSERDSSEQKSLKKQFKHALVSHADQFFLAEIVTLL